MKRLAIVLMLLVGLAGIHTAQGGSLDPPGPPAPTMKPLDEVQPRIAIRASDFAPTGYVISQPGSYYFVEDIVTSSPDFDPALLIQADGVSLDLMGFRLVGNDSGIGIAGDVGGISIRNGIIENWNIGIEIGENHFSLTDLNVARNNNWGISVAGGFASGEISRCIIGPDNSGGVFVDTTSGFVVRVFDSVITGNFGIGIQGSTFTLRDTLVTTNFGGGVNVVGGVVEGCSIWQNEVYGINAGGGSVIRDNSFRQRTADGSGVQATSSCIVVGNIFSGYAAVDAIVGSGAGIAPVLSPSTATNAWANLRH